MIRAESRARIAMEIFVEQNQIAPMWIGLKYLAVAEHGPSALFGAQENVRQSPRKLRRNFPQSHPLARASRAIDRERVAEIVMKFLQRFDKQKIHRKPYRSAPIGIAAECAGHALARLVADSIFRAARTE